MQIWLNYRDARGYANPKIVRIICKKMLKQAITLVKQLLKDGYHPILFCRFIPTAKYVADQLRRALPNKVKVAGRHRPATPYTMDTALDPLLDGAAKRDGVIRTKGVRYTVRPQLPPDVLGIYLLLPVIG